MFRASFLEVGSVRAQRFLSYCVLATFMVFMFRGRTQRWFPVPPKLARTVIDRFQVEIEFERARARRTSYNLLRSINPAFLSFLARALSFLLLFFFLFYFLFETAHWSCEMADLVAGKKSF